MDLATSQLGGEMGNELAYLLSLHVQADGMGLPKLCLVGVLVRVSRGEKEQ